jgi:uncharacterized repeat protein (TIGR01451 family)
MRYVSAPKRSRRQFHLTIPEQLESRRLMATFTVMNTNDNGSGSLRQAIVDANAAANPVGDIDRIAFDIPGEGVHTISVTGGALPEISDPVSIDGFTQHGSIANTNSPAAADNAMPLIEIDGSAIQDTTVGLTITAGGSTVRGLIIDGFSSFGLLLTGAGGNHIAGNFIGTNAAGTDAKGNALGVVIGSPDNTIGGTTAGDRNIISGNGSGGSGFGVYLSRTVAGTDGAPRTVIQGNFIGTDKTGTVAVPNHNNGVLVSIGDDTTIGGTTLAARNLISGNFASGIAASGHRTIIQGNLIGTDITGTTAIGNSSGVDATGGIDTTIGGVAAGAGNIISGNNLGIDIEPSTTGTLVQGNVIGTDATATINLGNRIVGILAKTTSATIGGTASGAGNVIAFSYAGNGTGIEYFSSNVPVLHNSIFGNAGEGILFSPGIAPKLTSATTTMIAGTLTGGAPNATYHLEFFATPDLGAVSDKSQGKVLLGEKDVPTDASGAASFSISPTGGVPSGQFLTATATSPTGTTSNFSAAIKVPVANADAADVGVTVSVSPGLAAPDGTMTETITVTNIGPDASQDVTLTVPVPAKTTFVSFATTDNLSAIAPEVGSSGGAVTVRIPSLAANTQPLVFTLAVAVEHETADGSTISESATIASATTVDPEDDNNHASATTTVRIVTPEPTADLVVTNSASPGNATVGTDNVVFTVTLTNNGPSPASHVTLTQSLPAGALFVSATGGISPTNGVLTFVAGDMSVGAHVSYTIAIRPQSAGTLTSTATASASEPDPSDSNNTAVASAVAVDAPVIPQPVVTTSQNPPATAGPRLIGVRRFGIHAMPTTVVLTFSNPLEPAIRQLRNYRITSRSGARVSIQSAVYNQVAQTLTLHPSQRLNIHHPYQLTISGEAAGHLKEGFSRELAGQVKAQPGSEFAIRLTWRQLVLPPWYRRPHAAASMRSLTVAHTKAGHA